MPKLKKGIKIFLKVLLIIIIAPIVIHAGYLFIQSVLKTTSIYVCGDFLQGRANDFMAEHGNRYFALDLVYYITERDPYFCEARAGHEEAFAALLKKYPEMRDVYLGAIVSAILDGKTKNFNRIQLLYVLEQNTGIKFRGDMHGAEYDDMKPCTQKGIRNVADWWTKHLEENATAAVAATEKDYLYPPRPKKFSQRRGIKSTKRHTADSG